jgi:Flp pilus assembly protein TadG
MRRQVDVHDERGLIAVMFTLMLVVILGITALVIDIGNGRQQRRAAQASADAAALAGAEVMSTYGQNFTGSSTQWSAIVGQVKAYAAANFNTTDAMWSRCSDPGALSYHPDATTTCISANEAAWPALSGPSEDTIVNHIRVRVPTRSFSTFFGGIVGTSSLSLQASSTAAITRKHTLVTTYNTVTTPGGPCAICLLGSGLTLDATANGDITVTGGNVIVDSTATTAANAGPNANVKVNVPAGSGYVIGGPGAPANFSSHNPNAYSPTPSYHDAVPDPLAAVPQCGDGSASPMPSPAVNFCPTNAGSNGTSSGTALSPGVYSTISGSHVLSRGIYVVTGGISVTGNSVLQGDGVMIFLACSSYPSPCASGQSGAGVATKGNGVLKLNAPTASDCTAMSSLCPYVGIMLFSDRSNTSTVMFRGNGTNEDGSHSGSGGTMYLKSGNLELTGNGYTLASQIIAGSMDLKGNPSGLVVAYDQNLNYKEYTSTTASSTTDAFSYDSAGLSG